MPRIHRFDKAFIELINWWLEDPTKRKLEKIPNKFKEKITDDELKFHVGIIRARAFPKEPFDSAVIRYKETLEASIRDEERNEMEKLRLTMEKKLHKIHRETTKTQWIIAFGIILSAFISGYIASPKVYYTPYSCPEKMYTENIGMSLINSGDVPVLINYEITGNNILTKPDVSVIIPSFLNDSYLNDGYSDKNVSFQVNILPKERITKFYGVVIGTQEYDKVKFSIKYSYYGWILDAIPFLTNLRNYTIATCEYTRDINGTFRLNK